MKTKSFFLIMLTYLVIFGALGAFFAYKGGEPAQGEHNVPAIFKEGIKEMFSKIAGAFKSIRIRLPINSAEPLFPRCDFKEGFSCLLHQEDKKGNTVLLNLRSLHETAIILYEVNISGSIVCNNSEERSIKAYEEFYVRLENCQFNGTEAKIELNYYRLGSSREFRKAAVGTLVAKG